MAESSGRKTNQREAPILLVGKDQIVQSILGRRGMSHAVAPTVGSALDLLSEAHHHVQVVLAGYQDALILLSGIDHRLTQVITMLPAYVEEPVVRSLESGAQNVIVRPRIATDGAVLSLAVARAIDFRRLILAKHRVRKQARKIKRLHRSEEQKTIEVEQALREIESIRGTLMESLLGALDARDTATKGHSQRVAVYAVKIASRMGIENMHAIEVGSLLHDIGKIAVPDAILRKPGRLNNAEWAVMRQHVEYGWNMVKDVECFGDASQIILHHHERYDGSGYPGKLRANNICMGARVFAVVDTYDAMTSSRVYRNRVSDAEAREEISRCSGGLLDPSAVDAFLGIPAEELIAGLPQGVSGGSRIGHVGS